MEKSDLSVLLIMLIIGLISLIFNVVIGLIAIIIFVFILIAKSSNKNSKEKDVSNILKKCFQDSLLKPVESVDKIELKKKLKIFDVSIYDKFFNDKVCEKGQIYYDENRVVNVVKNNQYFTCNVKGKEIYNTSLEFDEKENIINTECTCFYYNKYNENCKHIYALLLKIKCKDDCEIILKEINDYSKRIMKMFDEQNQYINKNSSILNNVESSLEEFVEYIEKSKGQVKKYVYDAEQNKLNQTILLKILTNLIEKSYKYSKEFEKIITTDNIKEETIMDEEEYEYEKKYQVEEKPSNDIIKQIIIVDEINKNIDKGKS